MQANPEIGQINTPENLKKLFKSKILHQMEDEAQKEIAADFLLNYFGQAGLLWPATGPTAFFLAEMGILKTSNQQISITSTPCGFEITEESTGQAMALHETNAIPQGAATNKHAEDDPIILIANRDPHIPLYKSSVTMAVDLTALTQADFQSKPPRLKDIDNLKIIILSKSFQNGNIDFGKVVKLETFSEINYKLEKLIDVIMSAKTALAELKNTCKNPVNSPHIQVAIALMEVLEMQLVPSVESLRDNQTSLSYATNLINSTLSDLQTTVENELIFPSQDTHVITWAEKFLDTLAWFFTLGFYKSDETKLSDSIKKNRDSMHSMKKIMSNMISPAVESDASPKNDKKGK